jgi:hypothetical protein
LQRKEKKTSYSTLTGAFEIGAGAKGYPILLKQLTDLNELFKDW